jgi:hypothetical protein
MFTIGTDPEFFIHDTKKFVSAIGRVPGSKEEPCPTSFGNIHADNVALELNVNPADSSTAFVSNMKESMQFADELVTSQGCTIRKEHFAEFEEDELKDPMAKFAGCDPDWNAYSLTINNPPCLYSTNYRSAGGHIHIGCEIQRSDIPDLVKMLDLLITVPMLKYEQKGRRNLYGKAGSFRVKPYGLEYRTPSNLWAFSSAGIEWVYDKVRDALSMYKKMKLTSECQYVIDMHDLEYAETIISGLKLDSFHV